MAPAQAPTTPYSCFDGPLVEATAVICGYSSSTLSPTAVQDAVAAALRTRSPVLTPGVVVNTSTSNTVGPGCSAGAPAPAPAALASLPGVASSCPAMAVTFYVEAQSTQDANTLAQVLASYPQDIAAALGGSSTTALGPVCLSYPIAPGGCCKGSWTVVRLLTLAALSIQDVVLASKRPPTDALLVCQNHL